MFNTAGNLQKYVHHIAGYLQESTHLFIIRRKKGENLNPTGVERPTDHDRQDGGGREGRIQG